MIYVCMCHVDLKSRQKVQLQIWEKDDIFKLAKKPLLIKCVKCRVKQNGV